MTTAARRDANPSVPRADDALLDAWERHLSTRPEHTRAAYARDARALKALAGDAALSALSSAEIRRCLAMLHQRGLSAASLARMLSAWRAFYRFLLERDPMPGAAPRAGPP